MNTRETNRAVWGLAAVLASVLVIIARREDGPEALAIQQALMAQGLAGVSVWTLVRRAPPHPRLRAARWMAAALVILMAVALGGMWLSPRGYAVCGGVTTIWAPQWTFPVYLVAFEVAAVLVALLQPDRASAPKWIAVGGLLASMLACFIAASVCL
jgi:hypothetical protein